MARMQKICKVSDLEEGKGREKIVNGRPLALFNGGIIPLCNVAIALKVCASLFLVMVVLSALRVRAGGSSAELTAQEEE